MESVGKRVHAAAKRGRNFTVCVGKINLCTRQKSAEETEQTSKLTSSSCTVQATAAAATTQVKSTSVVGSEKHCTEPGTAQAEEYFNTAVVLQALQLITAGAPQRC